MNITEEFYFAPDAIIWTERSLYMVRPLTRRYWLRHAAIRDARRIVSGVHPVVPQEENA
jgi:hypothetical protein